MSRGNSTSASAAQTGSWAGAATAGDTVTIASNLSSGDPVQEIYTAVSGTPGAFQSQVTTTGGSGAKADQADKLVTSINANSLLVTASNGTNGSMTVTSKVAGAGGNNIGLADTAGNTFNWSGSFLSGGSGQANLVAFKNLYVNPSGTGFCPGTAPTVSWAYNVSTGSSGINTSPILSLDGTEVAFVEDVSGGAVLHVLRWKTGEGAIGAPATPTTSTSKSSTWTSCLAGSTSCMFNLAFGTTNDSHSSPFVDYLNDTLYVGDNNGNLFKIAGVFNGTPAKRTSASSPAWGDSSGALLVASSSGKFLTSPVLDYSDNRVWVGVGGTDGVLKFVNTATSPATVSTGLGIAKSGNLNEGPIVDGTNHTVFMFTSDDSGTTGALASAAVVQANVQSSAPAQLTRKGIGKKGTSYIRAGAFTDAYFTTPSSGYLYACGRGISDALPRLYRFGFNGATPPVMQSQNGTELTLTTGSAECLPLSELKNGTNDRLFAGVTVEGGSLCASSGCVQSFDGINGTMPSTTAHTVSENGGTSGIVVDNVSSSAEASSIYFSTLPGTTSSATGCKSGGLGYCAVKLTQSGLQ